MEQSILFKFLIILIILVFMVQTINERYNVLKEYLSYILLITVAALTCYLVYLNNILKDVVEAVLWVCLVLCFLALGVGIDINDTKTIKVSCNSFAIILIILIIFFI